MLRTLIAISAGLIISSTAFAEPLSLTDKQMDQVTAGSFAFDSESQPALAGASPTGGQAGVEGPLEESFGPNASVHPNLAAWIAHGGKPPSSPSQGRAGDHTPLVFGRDQ